jgi:branched-chain amino acid transport system permease protein
MFAFFIGCATAGISGALLAHWQGFITSGTFSAADSIGYIGVLIICGLGSIWSPVTGAIIFVLIFRVIAPALAGINLAPSENLTALTTVYALVITAAGAVAALRLRKKSWKIWM